MLWVNHKVSYLLQKDTKDFHALLYVAVVDGAIAACVSFSMYSKSFEASELLVPLRVHGERELLASETPEPATEKDYLPIHYISQGYANICLYNNMLILL